MISLTSYAVVCSNVVVHNSDHNAVMVAIVDYYKCSEAYANFAKLSTLIRNFTEYNSERFEST